MAGAVNSTGTARERSSAKAGTKGNGTKTNGAVKSGKKKGRTKRKTAKKSAVNADKHHLYQESVQNPDFEVSFFNRVYRKFHGKPAERLREDFCGTALLAAEWVKKGGEALGVDLDGPTLEWGREHNITPLGEKAAKLHILQDDVRKAHEHSFKPDIVAALNFSYFIFKQREDLKAYFASVYRSLPKGGVFLLDIYGGPEAQQAQVEITEYDGFDYEWDQDTYNPITGEVVCHIHFKVKRGPDMRKAFSYDWRLWSMPEVRDILREVGFAEHDVYWEGTDKETGEGNGVYRLSKKGDDADAWIAYIACKK